MSRVWCTKLAAELALLVVAACGDDSVESGGADDATARVVVDGVLDCPPEEQMEPPVNIDGPEQPTVDEALRYFLTGTATTNGDEIRIIDERTASIVVDGHEVKVARAFEGDDGGWLAYTSYCDSTPGDDFQGPNPPRTEPPVTATG